MRSVLLLVLLLCVPFVFGVSDLSAFRVGDSVVLSWSAVLVDGVSASGYQVRYASDESTVSGWGSAFVVVSGECALPVGVSAGALQSCSVVASDLSSVSFTDPVYFRVVPFVGVLGSSPVFGSLSNVAGVGVSGDVVTVSDLLFVVSRLGSSDSVADVNVDGVVNVFDLVVVATRLGLPRSSVPGWGSEAPVDTTPPSTVTGLSATVVSSSQVNLVWSAATDTVGVTGYRVERCMGSSCSDFVLVASPTSTTFSNTGLSASTTYRYRVRAVDAADNFGSYSTVVSATTQSGSTPPPSGGYFIFSSSWDAATGNSWEAISDGNAWNQGFWCPGRDDVLSVVPGAPLGWTRSNNVFAIRMRGGDGAMCGGIQRREVVPPSTTHWGRMYVRSDLRGWDGGVHNANYNFVGNIGLVFFNLRGNEEGWRFNIPGLRNEQGVSFSGTSNEWILDSWQYREGVHHPDIRLDHGTWYRYEWMLEYITEDTYRFWPRLYDSDGELVFDASNIYHLETWQAPSRSLEYYYTVMDRAFGVRPETGIEDMRHIGLGNEGRPGPDTGEYWYHADFAISLDGWIGDR